MGCWSREMTGRCRHALRCDEKILRVIVSLTVMAGSLAAYRAPEIYYNPQNGILSLVNDIPTSTNPGLDDFTLFLANTADLPTTLVQGWQTQYGWVSAPLSDRSYGEIDWGKSGFGFGVNVLPPGTYQLTTLATGLTDAAFGGGGNGNDNTTDGQTYGSVNFGDDDGNVTYSTVQMINAVSSENDWIGASGGLWGTSGNWSLSAGTATQRVPLATDTATFGNQYGNLGVGTGGTVNVSGTQSVGSLAFNSTNSYTLQPTAGTTALLSLSSSGDDHDRFRAAHDFRSAGLERLADRGCRGQRQRGPDRFRPDLRHERVDQDGAGHPLSDQYEQHVQREYLDHGRHAQRGRAGEPGRQRRR